jgi:glycosidase
MGVGGHQLVAVRLVEPVVVGRRDDRSDLEAHQLGRGPLGLQVLPVVGAFGTVDETQSLIREAQSLGLRVFVDLVPNHCSEQLLRFQALAD